MDFELSAGERVFEAEVERFLAAHHADDVMDALNPPRCGEGRAT